MITTMKNPQTTSNSVTGRVYGYIRVSTDKQDNSLEVQQSIIQRYADFSEYPQPEWVIDPDTSGGSPLASRKEGGRMLRELQPGDIICVAKLDRIFRSAADGLLMLESWSEDNIALHLINMNQAANAGTSDGFLFIATLLVFAQAERMKISERTSEVQNFLQSSGRRINPIGKQPYGFKAGGEEKRFLLVDEYEQKVMQVIEAEMQKRIDKAKSRGKKLGSGGYSEIGRTLGMMKYKTRTGSYAWPSATVRSIWQRIESGENAKLLERVRANQAGG